MPVALIVPQKKTIAVVGKSFVTNSGGGGGGSGTVTSIVAGTGLGAPTTGFSITTAGTINLLAPANGNIGGVKAGSGIAIDVNGVLSIKPPTASIIGGVKADGSTTSISADGTITALASGGGGTPGGSNTQIQFNSNSSFGGSSGLTWNGTQLGVNIVSSAAAQVLSLRSDTGVRIADNNVNFISMAGNSATNSPVIATAGSDANINLVIYGKGTGGIQIGTLANPTPLIAANALTPSSLTSGTFGQVLTSAGAGKTPYWSNISSGGGSGFTGSAIWTLANSTNKNAYISPGNVNTLGITIALTASSGSGFITNVAVFLNNIALGTIYTSSGNWPNYTITIPSVDLVNNPAEVASTVNVSLQGMFDGGSFNAPNIAILSNTQPTPFTTTLSAAYTVSSVPYYQTTAPVSWSYTNTSAITSFGGSISIIGQIGTLNCTSPSGTFGTPQPIIGGSIIGTANGNGFNGAGTSTVTLSGTLLAISTFIPAFYAQTSSSATPTFTTSSTQTPAAAAGSTITYPVATAATQYNWIATNRPLANLILVSPFGNSPLDPDITAPTQTIAGQVMNVYGWSGLGIGTSSILVIS